MTTPFVDPKALEIAASALNYGSVDEPWPDDLADLARAITALLREREEKHRDAVKLALYFSQGCVVKAEAALRERDEEIARLKAQIETNDRKAQETAVLLARLFS